MIIITRFKLFQNSLTIIQSLIRFHFIFQSERETRSEHRLRPRPQAEEGLGGRLQGFHSGRTSLPKTDNFKSN